MSQPNDTNEICRCGKDEIWKSIIGYEGFYSVSNFGVVRNEKKRQGTWKNRILKAHKDSTGYFFLRLYRDGIGKNFGIHRIVANAFIGEKPMGFEINHKDGDKENNYFFNLEYTTRRENILHGYRLGLYPRKYGNNATNAKLSSKNIIFIRKSFGGCEHNQPQLAKMFNVKQSTISSIVLRKSWRHL